MLYRTSNFLKIATLVTCIFMSVSVQAEKTDATKYAREVIERVNYTDAVIDLVLMPYVTTEMGLILKNQSDYEIYEKLKSAFWGEISYDVLNENLVNNLLEKYSESELKELSEILKNKYYSDFIIAYNKAIFHAAEIESNKSYELLHNNLKKLNDHLQDNKSTSINYGKHSKYGRKIKPGVIVEILIKMPNNEIYTSKGEHLLNGYKKEFYLSLVKVHNQLKSHQFEVYSIYDSSFNCYCLYWELEREYNNRQNELIHVLDMINKNSTYARFVADVSKIKLDENMGSKKFKDMVKASLGENI